MPFFDIFASLRWSPLRMRTRVVSFFIFFQELSNKKKIKALRPKMTKIASRGTANTLVLKFGTLPLSGLFSNTLLAIFDILFRSRVSDRFVPKNGPKLMCGRVFQHNFISKANLKNPEQGFLVPRLYLLKKQKDRPWQGRFSTWKQ